MATRAKRTAAKATKVQNPVLRLGVEISSGAAWEVLEVLRRAQRCAYCSKDDAMAHYRVEEFIRQFTESYAKALAAHLTAKEG